MARNLVAMIEQVDRAVAWTKERRLVAAILGADWSHAARRRWDPQLFSGIDWTKIPGFAWQFKIRPMTAAALREASWPNGASAIRGCVEAAERQCAQNAMRQLKLLMSLAAAAEQQSIRMIALKGVALSLYLYGDPFIRESFDLDLLVHPDDCTRFGEVLRALGCAPLLYGAPLTPRQMAILRGFHHDDRFVHAETGTIVESHYLLERNPHLIGTDFDSLWTARAQVPLPAGHVAILGNDDLVRHLGAHAARHGWQRWKWIADLAALFSRMSAADIGRQRAKAAKEGNEDMFDSSLLLIEAVAGATLPRAALEQAARNRRACVLSGRALHLSCPEKSAATITNHLNVIRQAVFSFGLKRSLRYILFEMAYLVHRDKDWYDLRLPDALIWLYYVLRPFNYAGRRVKALLH